MWVVMCFHSDLEIMCHSCDVYNYIYIYIYVCVVYLGMYIITENRAMYCMIENMNA